MAGLEKTWATAADHLGATVAETKRRLGGIVRRRNQMCTRATLKRMERMRTIDRNPISVQEVEDDIQWIRDFIMGIEKAPRK